MRQLKMIQDWGSNYVYLRQPKASTRINLVDHSYQDVAKTPVEEFEVISIGDDSDIPSWVKMSSYKGTGDNKGLNWDSKVDQIPSQEEDCIILPLFVLFKKSQVQKSLASKANRA